MRGRERCSVLKERRAWTGFAIGQLAVAARRRGFGKSVATVAALVIFSLSALAAKNSARDDASAGDFFIISSVDLAKQQLLLKFPTEVTEVMRVNDDTRYLDESGKPIKLADLRAGDTVYVASVRGAEGLVAVRIRKGPMTLEELHRRYVQGAN
jgi:hypothetical protein